MKNIVVVMLILLSGMAYSDVRTDKNQVLNETKLKILENLKQIENSYFKLLDFEERRKALRLMDETIKMVLNEELGKKYQSHRAEPNVMGDEAFKMLLKQVNETVSDTTKTDLIISACANGFISVVQMRSLLESYSFKDNKVYCIETVYDRIYDKANISILIALFPDSFARDRLVKYIKDHPDRK